MSTTFRPLELALPASPARLAAALAASLVLHAAAALTLAATPPGSPSGQGGRTTTPLPARLVVPGVSVSAAAPPQPALPVEAPSAVRPEKTPKTLATAPPARRGEAPAQALGLGAETIHYLPSELDVRPRLRTPIDPPYPRVAPPDGGYLVLQLLISETGAVEKVNVAAADPEGFFEQTAIEAFAAARFAPGMRNGVAVKSQTWIELKFHPLVPPGAAADGADPTPR
jgi:protein TonB